MFSVLNYSKKVLIFIKKKGTIKKKKKKELKRLRQNHKANRILIKLVLFLNK